MLYALLGILFLFADQLLKFWTVSRIELNAYPGKELIPGVLNMTYIKNSGMAFGLFSKFSGLRWVLLGLLAAFTVFIVLGIIMRYLRTGFARFTGTMLLAGLLGNGIDRAIYGYVVDMFEPKLGSINWPIFNLADCLVVIFGILFCIALLTGGIGSPDAYEDEEEDEYLDDEEDEEEDRPRRRLFGRRKDEDEDEDEDEEDEEEEEEERPRRRRRVREEDAEEPVRRRPRRVRNEDDAVEAPAPRRRPTAQEAEAAVRRPRREAPESDATVRTVERPAAPKAEPVQPAAPKAEPKPAQPAVPKAQPKPAQPAAPKAEPKPVPAEPPKADSEDEFDLDSILAEFK